MAGSTISFVNLIDSLREYDVESYVILPKDQKDDHELIKQLESMGCVCKKCHITNTACTVSSNRLKSLVKYCLIYFKLLRSTFEVYKLVKEIKPDIIHTNVGVIHEGYNVSKLTKIKHVWHLREYQTKDFSWKIFPTENIFKKKLSLSYSICITKDIQDYFDLSSNSKSKVIYNPIIKSSSTKTEPSDKENYFLVANRIAKEKGIEDIIEAFGKSYIAEAGTKLIVAGNGEQEYVAFLKKKCENLGISENVNFIGYRNNITEMMIQAKAVIVGSYNEGFGRMTAEANMLGCLVIGRNSSGTHEILTETHGGFLFDSIDEFSEIIIKVCKMSNDDIKNFMILPQQKAIQLYNSEKSAENVMNLYKSILS